MDIKLLLLALTGIFTIACLFFGTKNGFYDSDDYHGNGSAH
ncbi:membrane protein [Picosynechococcus sp. NKBG15041c]|nr:membrane protein [Picosynechococcus sp. NKBG15041c]